MRFAQMVALIDERLQHEERLQDYPIAADPHVGRWSCGKEAAELEPSTATGVLVRLHSDGRVLHQRVFACSEMTVGRIARSISEHLTGYVR